LDSDQEIDNLAQIIFEILKNDIINFTNELIKEIKSTNEEEGYYEEDV